ncbi:MAG: Ig-like domain-containing protein [Solobacterium sp.]|nr:Ig-like domain-containing protein [Solobacterium sp.]
MKRILYTILAVLTAAVCLRPLNAENGWSLKTLDGETVTADAEGMTLLVFYNGGMEEGKPVNENSRSLTASFYRSLFPKTEGLTVILAEASGASKEETEQFLDACGNRSEDLVYAYDSEEVMKELAEEEEVDYPLCILFAKGEEKDQWQGSRLAADCLVHITAAAIEDLVVDAPEVTAVVISEPVLTLYVGETKTLTAEVLPEDAKNRSAAWTTSDPEVAEVDADGTVTAKKAGRAVITASASADPEIKGVCAVLVLEEGVLAVDPDPMYRVYNPNSGEHFYTANEKEKDALLDFGWKDEGVGWLAPKISASPVYRLYNQTAGDHHYTMNEKEKDALIKKFGWRDEGIGWYSDDAKAVPLYREYNPNMQKCNHNYTINKEEHNYLISQGWKDEGIGWYGVLPEPLYENK